MYDVKVQSGNLRKRFYIFYFVTKRTKESEDAAASHRTFWQNRIKGVPRRDSVRNPDAA